MAVEELIVELDRIKALYSLDPDVSDTLMADGREQYRVSHWARGYKREGASRGIPVSVEAMFGWLVKARGTQQTGFFLPFGPSCC